MKPPWMNHSREEAELEALQTDVMRFVAILGLCLAAIFSLVHSAALERTVQRAAEQAPVEAATDAPLEPLPMPFEASLTETRKVQARPTAGPRPEPGHDSKSETSAVGFTLEFASAGALQGLLQDGQVQLYARRGEQFWSVDSSGKAAPVAAPPSYYQMQSDTVPLRLRDALPGRGSGSGATWGVTLPAGMIRQIRQLTSSRQGGNLVIGRDGAVKFGADPGAR